MDINDFFDFRSKCVLSNFRAPPILDERKSGVDQLNDVYNLIRGNYNNIHFPVIFKQSDGKKINDVIDTEYASLYLISDRLKSILEENQFTGWKTFAIQLYDKKGNEVSGYHGLSVTGTCGPIDYEKSEIIEKRMTPQGPACRFYKGRYIGLDLWDGTDFFFPGEFRGIIITKKVAQVLQKNKITNVRLKNLADVEMYG